MGGVPAPTAKATLVEGETGTLAPTDHNPIPPPTPHCARQVFVADVLTSLSKAFADGGLVIATLLQRLSAQVYLANPQLFNSLAAALAGTTVERWGWLELEWGNLLALLLPPMLASMPYLLRMRQLVVARAVGSCGPNSRRNHGWNMIK